MGLSVGCLKGSSLSPIYISVSPIAIYNLQIGYFCLALFSPSCRIIATKGGSLAGQAAAKRRRTWSRNSSATVKWSDGRAYGTTCHPAAKEPGNPWWTACTPVLQAWYLHMNIWVPSKGYTFSLFMIFEQDIMSLKCVSNEIRVHQKNIDSQVSYRKRKLRINSHRVKSSSSSCNPAWPSKPRSPTITLEETSRFRVQRCPRIPELLWKENDTQKLETWSFPAKKKEQEDSQSTLSKSYLEPENDELQKSEFPRPGLLLTLLHVCFSGSCTNTRCPVSTNLGIPRCVLGSCQPCSQVGRHQNVAWLVILLFSSSSIAELDHISLTFQIPEIFWRYFWGRFWKV